MTVPLLPYQNPYVDYLGPVVQPNSKLIGLQWITELRACSPDHGGEFMIGKVIWALMTAIIMATPFLLIFLLIRTLRIGKVFEWGYVIVIGLTLIYNVYDNNRFILKEESVYIENLPLAFEGLTILQISDLHGKSFGRNQTNLTSQINRLDYDVIAFTGDMETTVRSFEPFMSCWMGSIIKPICCMPTEMLIWPINFLLEKLLQPAENWRNMGVRSSTGHIRWCGTGQPCG